MSFVRMGNVLDSTTQQQIVALGRLGWTVSRIAEATDVRRETAARYLRAAGLAVRGRGRPGEGPAKAAIASEVSTDLDAKPSITRPVVSTESGASRAPGASACEPYREQIVGAVAVGRNAMAIWQDLVDQSGFTHQYASVRRFVGHLRGPDDADGACRHHDGPG